MRLPSIVVAALFASAVASAPSVSSACQRCNEYFMCTQSPLGAQYCIQTTLVCAMLQPCLGGGNREMELGTDLTAFSLFESGGAAGAALRTDAGELTLGERMRTAHTGDPLGALLEAGVVHGDGFSIAFTTRQGDGFVLRRNLAGGLVSLEVREPGAGGSGRILATGLLGVRDRLVVPVRVAGRERLLVLQAARLLPAAARFGERSAPAREPVELVRLREALRASAQALPAGREPLFEVRAE